MESNERVKLNEKIFFLLHLFFFKNPEGKESHKKIDLLMNEERHEINDDSKMAELLNSFFNLLLTRERKQRNIDN